MTPIRSRSLACCWPHLGAFLALAGAGLLIFVPLGRAAAGKAFLIYGLFVVLLLMGLAMLAAGINQAMTGYKQTSFISVFLVLLIAAALIAAVIRLVFALT